MNPSWNFHYVAMSVLFSLLALGAAVVCYLNLRLSRHLWLVMLGFLLWSGAHLWGAVFVILISSQTVQPSSPTFGVFRVLFMFVGWGGSFAGWLAFLVGLSLVFRDMRTRLENYESAWRLIEKQEQSAEERTQ